MSLINFHRFLISAAILFCLGYAGFEVVAFQRTAQAGSLLIALLFALLAIGLMFYLWRLPDFLRSGGKR